MPNRSLKEYTNTSLEITSNENPGPRIINFKGNENEMVRF